MNRKSYFAQETFVLQSKATVEPVFVTKFFSTSCWPSQPRNHSHNTHISLSAWSTSFCSHVLRIWVSLQSKRERERERDREREEERER